MGSLNEKLINIQSELKAPKSQYNAFGKYNYRNCEDILEAVKPLLKKNGVSLRLTDDVRQVGDRYYIEATAILSDGESEISVKALAREEESKKGMDSSQVTGSSSSYARKYALNGLFDIDDTKDSDTTNTGNNNGNGSFRGQTTNNTPANKTAPKAKKTDSTGLPEEMKKKINNGIVQYKNLAGIESKKVLEILKDKLGYSVADIKNEEQGSEVIDVLLTLIADWKGKEGA